MICKHCGTPNEESVCVCADCGMPLQDQIAEQTPAAPTPKKTRKRLLFIIGGAVLTVALALLLIFGIRTPKSTVNKALEAIENGDAKAIMKLLPKQVKKEFERQYEVHSDQIPETQLYLQKMFEEILSEKSVSIQIQEGPENLAQNGIDWHKDYYRDSYGLEIDSIKECQLYIICTTSDGHQHSENSSLRVIKVNGNWYIDFRSLEKMVIALYLAEYDPGCCV